MNVKIIIKVLLFFSFFFSCAPASEFKSDKADSPIKDVNLQRGLQLYYHFNYGNILDYSGNNRRGRGLVSFDNDTDGNPASCAYFNGTGYSIESGNWFNYDENKQSRDISITI